jgi:hypothetical protein
LVWQREFIIMTAFVFHLFVNTNLAYGRFDNTAGIYLFAIIGMG